MRVSVLVAIATVAILAMVGARTVGAERESLIQQAPAEYARLQNPFSGDAEGIKVGERIYSTRCTRCHVADGDGKSRGPSLYAPEVKGAAPGALFWVLEKGSRKMPSFAKLPAKYRWQVISYLQQ